MIKYPKLQKKDWLEKEIKNKPLRQIADEIGCSYGAVIFAIRSFGILVPQRSKQRLSITRSRSCKKAHKKKYPKGRFGELASNWKGGRRKGGNKGKYWMVYMPGHPKSDSSGYVMEHRLVIEKSIGRLLNDMEIVHHKDGNGQNNSLSNLQLTNKKDHFKEHFDSVKEVDLLKKIIAGCPQCSRKLAKSLL